ncbi:ribonuclease E/G [Alphaproteobacteria bacterium]|nr:ribonuclease E/G [Alphaproteobacteria bacterium]
MTKRLLIDARQAEETRVVLLSGTRIEDFDYETENRKQLKGNVYLARVTRVEPSLQAAFVEYGGNRQGFLAFSEIHPDYYRIPVEDREALIEAERAENEEDVADAESEDAPETVGGEGGDDDEIRPKRHVRKYKIQEVISRKQIMLVQVVKEERGNKGAALTTYLSLAGRYCVLMPNSNRGGGVSRKITNMADRKRLKTVVGGLDVNPGMAVIVRTAGAKRTKTEIARDYAYLSKLWDDIRTRTLESQAPSVIHEEGNLIKRSIRDLYTSEVDEILVEGEEAYKTARNQMKMLIPSHVKKVAKYEDSTPIFQRYQVESQMDTIQSPQVTLKSGGYLVINQTEALVAVDVNSGRSTRERNIEETALKTNLEAAEELARQLRLRDLSGLIVVDFIDMDEGRNRHAVERKMKDSMRNDRARIQIGGISHFGLLEMSRQRLRLSINESISDLCPHCEGTGRIRSIDTASLQMLRIIEEEAQRNKMDELHITMHRDVALFILNHKRSAIAEIEERCGLRIVLLSDDSLIAPDYRVEYVGLQGNAQGKSQNRSQNNGQGRGQGRSNGKSQNQRNGNRNNQGQNQAGADANTDDDSDADTSADNDNNGVNHGETPSDEDQPKRRKRGRRGGRRRRRRNGENGEESANGENAAQGSNDQAAQSNDAASNTEAGTAIASDNGETADNAEAPAKKRRSRGRGRQNSDKAVVATGTSETSEATEAADSKPVAEASGDVAEKPKRATRKKAAPAPEAPAPEAAGAEGGEDAKPAAKKPARTRKKKAASDDAAGTADAQEPKAPKASKAKAKKAASPAKATKKVAAKSDAKSDAKSGANEVEAEPTRAAVSSAPEDVVDVSAEKPKGRKGWWNRG